MIQKSNNIIIKTKEREWQDLHSHYTYIKLKYKLTSSDIFKQLSINYYLLHLEYLSVNGCDRNPSNKPYTIGKLIRDTLMDNITKTNWLPSVATYEDKLIERQLDGYNPHIHILFKNNSDRPNLDVKINSRRSSTMSKKQLKHILTVDGIIPRICDVSYHKYS